MRNESTTENQAANLPRVFFDTDDESTWQEDADELYGLMTRNFHADSPAVFINLLMTLRNLPSKSWVESAIDDLMRAAFLSGGMTDQVVEQFARACLHSPEPWNLLTGHPQSLKDGEGFQFDFAGEKPSSSTRPGDATVLTINLCDYESFFMHVFNRQGDAVFQIWTRYEEADELQGTTVYLDSFEANKSRFYVMNLNARPRRNVKKHKGELTLADNSVVRFTDK